MTESSSPHLFRAFDDHARQLALRLLAQASFAALGVLEPQTGWPLVSRVSLARDGDLVPLILISQLSGHFSGLLADARCSLLVGEPQGGDPLAHPRMTLCCQAQQVPQGEAREAVKLQFLKQQPKAELYADFGDFAFWRLVPEGISLNAGFGRAYAFAWSELTG